LSVDFEKYVVWYYRQKLNSAYKFAIFLLM